jgi:hypothetical protein
MAAVILTGLGTYILIPPNYDLYNSDVVQNMTGMAADSADTLYGMIYVSPMIIVGAIFMGMYMQATRSSGGVFG